MLKNLDTNKMANDGITKRIKSAYQALTEKKPKHIIRRQYNVMIDYEIVLGIKVLAATLKLPQYIVCEYVMELGSNEMLKSMKTSEQRQELRNRLTASNSPSIWKSS